MQEAGFNVVRVGEFTWAKIEPTQNHYGWSWLDRAIGILPLLITVVAIFAFSARYSL